MNDAPTFWVVLVILWFIVTGRVEGVVNIVKQGAPHDTGQSKPVTPTPSQPGA